MDLTLTILSHRNAPPEHPISLAISERDCAIGRNPGNDLVLPDPERFVSGVHVRILYRDGHYYVTDNSTNGTFINGAPQPLGRGNTAPLNDGDILAVGEYILRVTITAPPPFPEAIPPARPPVTPPPTLSPDELLEPLELLDPRRRARLEPTPAEKRGEEPPGRLPGETLPESKGDWDLWRPPGSETGRRTVGDHAPEEQYAYQPPPAIPEGWDLLTDQEPQGVTAAAEPAPPTAPGPPKPPGAPAAFAGAPFPTAHGAEEALLLGALLEGLGIEPSSVSAQQRIAFARRSGRLLRIMTERLMLVLRTRATFKRELRLETTQLSPTENNPFKFAGNGAEALTLLLAREDPGFMPAGAAAEEALDDILAHEAALIAGLQAALQGLLRTFDPAALERRFQAESGLSALLPLARKARYWELFEQVHAAVSRDAAEGFLRLFAQEFNQAYEEQVQKIRSARRPPQGTAP